MVKSRWVGTSLGGPEERNQQMMFLVVMKLGGGWPPFEHFLVLGVNHLTI